MYVNKENNGAVSSFAKLRSNDLKQASSSCKVSFYYFMSGITNSDASLVLKLQKKNGHVDKVWDAISDQGKHWNNVTASINYQESGWHLFFMATHIRSKGDIAIDEINLLGCVLPEKRKCANKEEFACLNGECINGSLVCDFSRDCSDGSDEVNCTDYLERCDFEKGFCNWNEDQDNTARLKWQRTSGKKLPEGSYPERDHTMNNDTGYFLVISTTSYYNWYSARIISTAFKADTSGNCKIRFWYHLYRSLSSKIDVTLQHQDDTRFLPVETLYGSNGDVWEKAEIVLKSKLNFHVAIEGYPVSGSKGSVAIDDTSFTLECIPVYTEITTPVPTIFPKGYCEKRGEFACEDNTCVPMNSVCDFKRDCLYGLDEKYCPAFCDFELGSTCGWQAFTKAGDGLEIDVTFAEESYKLVRSAPKVDKTTNTGQGSYLLIHNTKLSNNTPADDYQSPTFHSSKSTCKFSFWFASRLWYMDLSVVLTRTDETIDVYKLKGTSLSKWTKLEIGIGRQKDNFTVKFNKKGGFQGWDFVAIDDIEFVDCALPKKDNGICLGYRCKLTKACIEYDRVCDLTDDCGDNTDEENCTKNNFLMNDFESGLGIFKLSIDPKRAPISWERMSGTYSRYFKDMTGPLFDHTLSNTQGYYISMTKREGGVNERAWLISEVLSREAKGECNMRFYYFMYGKEVNELNIFTINRERGNFSKIWTETKAVGNYWMRNSVLLNDTEPFKVIFEGKAGLDSTDVIALDDISFSHGCKLIGGTLPPKEVTGTYPITTQQPNDCNAGDFPCKSDKKCIPGYKKCDFRDDCVDKSDEADCVKPKCEFENDLCGWEVYNKFTQNSQRKKRQADYDHAYQWINIQAKDNGTQINIKNRPKVDHTLNTTEGWYLLADGAPGIEGDATSLYSKEISATHAQCAIDFWVYRGPSYGKLALYAGKENLEMKKLWNEYDDLQAGYFWGPRIWEHAKVSLGALKNFKVMFEAVRPRSYTSVTCLDDISFEDCPPPEDTNPEDGSCDGGKFMCKNDKCIDDNLLCDFHDDCTDYSDERDLLCQPYVARCNFDGAPCNRWYLENESNAKWSVTSPGNNKFQVLPRFDHTTKSKLGKFLSLPIYYSTRNSKPKIRSETIDARVNDCRLRFWYNNINYAYKINVYKRTRYGQDGLKLVEALEKDVLSFWHRVEVKILNVNSDEDFQIVIEADIRPMYGSVNIDDISLTPGCHLALGRDIPGNITTPSPEEDDCSPRLSCENKECYLPTQRCNFIDDCGDGTDEKDCGNSCDFENSTCGWFNPMGYTTKWERQMGKDRYVGDLKRDHTSNSSEGYFLTVKSIRQVRDVSQVHTLNYVSSGSNCKFSMWYYFARTGGAELSLLLLHDTKNNKYEKIWNTSNDAGKEWQKMEVKIGQQHNFAVIIQNTAGNSYLYSSVAVDDIEFTACSPEHPVLECAIDEVMCIVNKDQCIKAWFQCDGKYDCRDKSDESDCKNIHGDCNFDHKDWRAFCKYSSMEMDVEWSIAKEGRSNETGPSRDYNLRQGEGSFLFLDSNQTTEGQQAGIMTPLFNASEGKCHLRFWYFMKGSQSMGKLEVKTESENKQSLLMSRKQGHQGDKWLFEHVPVGSDYNYRVAFIATRGGDNKTDIAIDEIRFTKGCEEGGIAFPDIDNGCYKDEYRCDNGQCIPAIFLCDCAAECKDGSDESRCDKPCPSTLPPKEWTTLPPSSRQPPSSVLPQKNCNAGEKLCADGLTCIAGLLLCDGIDDCPDGSDERDGCGHAKLCKENFYFCNDYMDPPCIHREKICDGHKDCSDGSDESLCNKCPADFCRNGGNCIVQSKVPVCKCQGNYAQNRCGWKRTTEEKEKPTYQTSGVGWIIGMVIGTLLLIGILFVIWYKRNTNAERSRLAHAVDNPVYGLNLDTLTFGELNSHMPVRSEDGAGSTAIENPLYAFKSEIK